MAYTAGQKVRAADLTTGLIAALTNNNVATTGLKIAFGTVNASFVAASFALTNISYSNTGFTVNPIVLFSPADGGSNGALTAQVGGITTSGAVLVPRTGAAGNITASVPLVWVAIGV